MTCCVPPPIASSVKYTHLMTSSGNIGGGIRTVCGYDKTENKGTLTPIGNAESYTLVAIADGGDEYSNTFGVISQASGFEEAGWADDHTVHYIAVSDYWYTSNNNVYPHAPEGEQLNMADSLGLFFENAVTLGIGEFPIYLAKTPPTDRVPTSELTMPRFKLEISYDVPCKYIHVTSEDSQQYYLLDIADTEGKQYRRQYKWDAHFSGFSYFMILAMFVAEGMENDFASNALVEGVINGGQAAFIGDTAMLTDCGMHRQAQGDAVLTVYQGQVLDMTMYRDIFVTGEYRDYDLSNWSESLNSSRLAQ